MAKIVRLIDEEIEIVTGAASKEFDKGNAMKRLCKVLDKNAIQLRLIDEDGDEEEESSSVSLNNVVMVSFTANSDNVKLYTKADVPEDERSEVTVLLSSPTAHGDWTTGLIQKRLNNAVVDSTEYVAVRSEAVNELPVTADNFIDAQMDWVFELLMGDHIERFGEDDDADGEDDEYDDGD